MIDTIKLRAEDFQIDSSCKIQVQPACFCADTGEVIGETELFRKNGVPVYGSKAFLNTERFHFDINFRGTFIRTEIPDYYSKNNYYSVSGGEFYQFSKLLEKDLREAGIYTDVERANISRLDLFKNGNMKKEPLYYFPVLRSCRGKRVYKRDYGDTVTFLNTQRQACFYDKYNQLASKGVNVSNIPRNTLRAEVRLTNNTVVKRCTGGITNMSELKQYYGTLKKVYEKQLTDMTFRYGTDKPEQLCLFGKDYETLSYFKEQSERTAFSNWIQSEGILNIIQRYGDIENIRHLLKQVFSKQAVSRQIKSLEKKVEALRDIKTEPESFLDLYNEMTDVFIRAA
jgi:hypothetical protein